MVAAVISIVVLGLLVIVHEFGHFLVARWVGVRVLRFSMGFGPRVWTWKRGHTEYALSAIPLGGYVKMAGEQQPDASPAKRGEPWEYASKPVGVRAAIILAGPLVNYLVAFLSLWTVFVIGYPEMLSAIGTVVEKTPAQAAGLQPGDRIQAVAGRPVQTWEEMTKTIYASAEQPLEFLVQRGERSLTLQITPQAKEITDPFGRKKTIGLIGVSPSGAFRTLRVPPVQAIGRAWKQQNEWLAQTLMALWSMATGRISVRESVTGPIGIVYLTSEAVKMGFAPLLFLVSLFSLSLALFNVFPIPILDGGHLLFLAVEKLRGRPVSLNVQERSAQVAFVLLVTFVVVVCLNDVSRFGLLDKLSGLFRR